MPMPSAVRSIKIWNDINGMWGRYGGHVEGKRKECRRDITYRSASVLWRVIPSHVGVERDLGSK